MKINITFLIQVGNFFITYYMLHALLFKPLLAKITTQREKERMLQAHLNEGFSRILARQRETREQLAAFQDNFATTFTIKEAIFPPIETDVSYPKDPEKIAREITQAQELIVTRLPHVD